MQILDYVDNSVINLKGIILEKQSRFLCGISPLSLKLCTAESFKLGKPIHTNLIPANHI